MKSALDEHSQWITDVRFSPSMSRLATSSADKTVRVWDADNVSWHIYYIYIYFFLGGGGVVVGFKCYIDVCFYLYIFEAI